MDRVPNKIVYGTESVAPAAGTVLADTGQLTAGNWFIFVQCASDDTVQNWVQVVHRNAANNADIELCDLGISAGPVPQGRSAYFTLVLNERVVVRNSKVGSAGKTYQASIFAWLLASPGAPNW